MSNISLNLSKMIAVFKESILQQFTNNLTDKTCATLANMLAMDYNSRLESTISIRDHLDSCINKLKNFLGQKVMIDDDFSTALTLFTVAISPTQINYQDKNNILEQEQSQDTVIEAIINTHFAEFDHKDLGKIKDALRSLLREHGKKILAYVNAEPHLFSVIINGSIAKYQNQEAINKSIKIQVDKILDKAINFNKKSDILKQKASKIATAVCTIGAVAVSALTAGIASPIMIIPAAILSMKFAPKLGERIGQVILNVDKNTKSTSNKISEIKAKLLMDNQKHVKVQKSQELEVSQKREMDTDTLKKHDKALEAIKSTLGEYKTDEIIKHEENFQEQVTKNKEMAKNKGGGITT